MSDQGRREVLGEVRCEDVARLQTRLSSLVVPLHELEQQSPNRAHLPDPALSFPAVVAHRARTEPHRVALHTVRFSNRDPVSTLCTYGELFSRAERAAAALCEHDVRAGDRVVLSVSDGADFTALLLAAQCLGAIPVPVPSADELPLRGYVARLSSVIHDAQPRVVVIDADEARAALTSISGEHAICDARALCEHAGLFAPSTFDPRRALHEIAFLQYTSGSTGDPKGVVVLHYNAVANMRAIIDAYSIDARDVVFSWLPLFHDMGLVAGLMLGIYLGIPTHIAAPRSFAARPDSWLRAITGLRASVSFGPNFAYHALAHRLPERALEGSDLRSWRVAVDGAEQVDPATVRDFSARFARYGFSPATFRPSYGMAEHTLAAALPRAGFAATDFDSVDRAVLLERGAALQVAHEAPGAATYTSCGTALVGHRLWIADHDGQPLAQERVLGEIVASGPSMTPGYFRELVAGAEPRRELRTGDLGYLADGRLFIVDRLKDVLVIAGRKLFPTDIERVVASVDGVRPGAVIAFAARGQTGSDDMFIAAGLEAGGAAKRAQLVHQIESAVRESFGITPAHVFALRPGRLPKTSSGKLRRSALAAMLERGELAGWESEAQVEGGASGTGDDALGSASRPG